jgi:hypothetical protein
MSDIMESISNFFARHRAHCAEHEVYHADCDACVRANDSGYVADWSSAGADFSGSDGNAFVDTSRPGTSSADGSGAPDFGGFNGGDASASVDTSIPDTSSADVSGSSDFGGFDGGDSGGGGASGDF